MLVKSLQKIRIICLGVDYLKKLKIAVLFGGVSFEHEVSLKSAFNVIENLKQEFEVVPIGINKRGEWFLYFGDLIKIKNGEWEQEANVPIIFSLNRGFKGFLKVEENCSFTKIDVDCVFPVLHGQNGEDGKLMGAFEIAAIPYVGCNLLSSALCMNKILTHELLHYYGIRVAKWESLKKVDLEKLEEKLYYIAKNLLFPIFTKPAGCGSSIGIRKCNNFNELKEGILNAFSYDEEVICEEFIDGKEVECAVLGGLNPKASAVGEISSFRDFYDYDSKYKYDSTLIIPAQINSDVAENIKKLSVKAFKLLGCYGLSRVDFFVTKKNEVILNEINTMPGFTNISMYTKLWEESKIKTKDLLKELIYLALKKN